MVGAIRIWRSGSVLTLQPFRVRRFYIIKFDAHHIVSIASMYLSRLHNKNSNAFFPLLPAYEMICLLKSGLELDFKKLNQTREFVLLSLNNEFLVWNN